MHRLKLGYEKGVSTEKEGQQVGRHAEELRVTLVVVLQVPSALY